MKNIIISVLILIGSHVSAQQAIYVTKQGKGSPVIFLPGFTSPGSVWNETASNLKARHENHFVSYAGFNGLPAIKTPWYSAIKTALITYITQEKLRNITLVGHSMGGTLALDVAAELPDLITKLVIVDALPCMLEVVMPGVSPNQLAYESPYNKRMLEMSDEAFLQTASMFSQGMTSRADKVDTLIRWASEADRTTYVYGYTDLLKLDLRASLDKIKAKTLILAAPFPSKEAVVETLGNQYGTLQSKKIEVAVDSRHFIMFDQPEWLYGHINSFLAAK